MKQFAILLLDEYEASNLLEALIATGYGVFERPGVHPSPLSVLHSGDWLGQIVIKLKAIAPGQIPNASAEQYAERARAWKP